MSDDATESVAPLSPAATLRTTRDRYNGAALFAWLARIRLAHRYQGPEAPPDYLAAFADETGLSASRLRELLEPDANRTGPTSDAANAVARLIAMELGEDPPESSWHGERVALVAPDDGTVRPQIGQLVRAHVHHLSQRHNRGQIRGTAVSADELTRIIRGEAPFDTVRRLLEHWQATFEADTALPGLRLTTQLPPPSVPVPTAAPAREAVTPTEPAPAAPVSEPAGPARPAITPTVIEHATAGTAMATTPEPPAGRRGPGAKRKAPKLPPEHIGNWVERQITESGITQQAFAGLTGDSPQNVSEYRRGRKPAPRAFIERVIQTRGLETTFEAVRREFPEGHSPERTRARGGARARRRADLPPDWATSTVGGQPASLAIPRAPRFTPVTDATSDAAFEAHVEALLAGGHRASLGAGWPWLAAVIRRARIAAGRSMEQQAAAYGDIARIVEAGGGHESHRQLADVLAMARRLATETVPVDPGGDAIDRGGVSQETAAQEAGGTEPAPRLVSEAELDRLRKITGTVARHRLDEATGRLISARAGHHFVGCERTLWPRLGAYLAAVRESRGQSAAEVAAELGVSSEAIREIENGGGYDLAFPVSDSSGTTLVDLRPIGEQLVRRSTESDSELTSLEPDQVTELARLLTFERGRDYRSYRKVLEARTPAGAESWRNLAVQIYQHRRRGGQTREGVAAAASLPVAVVGAVETGDGARTHRGFYDAELLVSRMFRGTDATLATQLLKDHHTWLTQTAVAERKARPEPFEGWRDSGLPELGVALLDARERHGMTVTALARHCDVARREIEQAEAGFAQTGSANVELVDALMARLEFTAEQYRKHTAAVSVLTERETLEAMEGDESVTASSTTSSVSASAKPRKTSTSRRRGRGLTDAELAEFAAAYDSGITSEGGRRYLLDAPRVGGRRVQWTEKGLLTVLSSDLPLEVGSPPDDDRYLHVYVRAAGVPKLFQDPAALARLEAAIAHWEENGEASRLRLRVLPAEHDDAFPHDFGALAGKDGTTFVALDHTTLTPHYDAVDVTELLVDAEGRPLETVEGRPMTPPNYAGELTTRLGLVTGVGHNPGAELSFWNSALARLRADRASRTVMPRTPGAGVSTRPTPGPGTTRRPGGSGTTPGM